jgi:hypothetical protein
MDTDGERIASIGLRADRQLDTLSYRVTRSGGECRDVEQPTPVVWVSCRFGGQRPYFLCPGPVCGRRVSKLYGLGIYFLCRHCYRLTYASQREDPFGRALRRANNIRMQLGGEPGLAAPFPERPKGMHRRTYDRLSSEVWHAGMCVDEGLTIFLEGLRRIEGWRRSGTGGRSGREFWV